MEFWASSSNFLIEGESETQHSKILSLFDEYNSNGQANNFETFLLDLVYFVSDGKITVNQAVTFLKQLKGFGESSNAIEMLSDSTWFWGTQLNNSDESYPRLCAFVKELYTSKLVPPIVFKLSLELGTLVGTGLANDEAVMNKKLVKLNTGLMYRQQKYNLLREETEGFAKLCALLSRLPSVPSKAHGHIRHVMSLIGYFDLDPNRVLDVVLSLFQEQIWNACFLSLLKEFRRVNIVHSIGFKLSLFHTADAANLLNQRANDLLKQSKIVAGKKEDSEVKPVDKSNESPPVLGPTPESLYDLLAVLIANGFITLPEILPYLQPSLDDTASAFADHSAGLRKGILQYGVISLSATSSLSSAVAPAPKPAPPSLPPPVLLTASPLVGDEEELDSEDESSSMDPKETQTRHHLQTSDVIEIEAGVGNQVAGLVAALLRFRCWDLASVLVSLLEQRGVDVMCFSSARRACCDLLIWRLEAVYQSVSMKRFGFARSKPMPLSYTPDASLGSNEDSFTSLSIRCEDVAASSQPSDGQCSQFAFTTLPALLEDMLPMLRCLKSHIGASAVLLSRLCRLLKAHMPVLLSQSIPSAEETTTSAASAEVATLLSIVTSYIMPALSVSEGNAFLSNQVWGVLSLLPFHQRFEIYDSWRGAGLAKDGIDSKPHEQALSETISVHSSRGLYKRLSKENTKLIGRQVAKWTHNCPLPVHNHVIDQIEKFENLIPIVVDTMKYQTELSRDTMAYLLVTHLGKDGFKLKDGDTHYSQWFASLARFIAVFYRRYPSTELKGMLHCLLKRLAAGKSLDLLVLKELLEKMGGCETLLELSPVQLEGLGGGRVLRMEVMGSPGSASNSLASSAPAAGAIPDILNKNAVRILRDELMSSGTALPLLLYIAQIRSRILHATDTPHLKLISHLFDTAQDVLMQFTDFLVAGCKSMEAIAKLMPPLSSLLRDSGLSLSVAFQLVRPLVRAALSAGAGVNGDSVPEYLKKWHPYNDEMLKLVASCFPFETSLVLSPEVLVTFWSLSLYDLAAPEDRYSSEIKRLRERYAELDTLQASPQPAIMKQRKANMTMLLNVIKDLTDELEVQKKHVELVRKMLVERKGAFLFRTASSADWSGNTDMLLQTCLLDRILMSPADAVFCSQFVLLLHDIETPGFSTIQFVNKLIRTVSPLIFCTTEAEASFVGYALNDILRAINSWLNDKRLFEKACHKVGFVVKRSTSNVSIGSGPPAVAPTEPVTATSEADKNLTFIKFISFAEYEKVTKAFWRRLREVLMAGMMSKEYMYLRSALLLLSKLVSEFPSTASIGNALLSRIDQIEKEEGDTGRGDLKLMAKSLAARLRKQASAWKKDISAAAVAVSSSGGTGTSGSSNAHALRVNDLNKTATNHIKADGGSGGAENCNSGIEKTPEATVSLDGKEGRLIAEHEKNGDKKKSVVASSGSDRNLDQSRKEKYSEPEALSRINNVNSGVISDRKRKSTGTLDSIDADRSENKQRHPGAGEDLIPQSTKTSNSRGDRGRADGVNSGVEGGRDREKEKDRDAARQQQEAAEKAARERVLQQPQEHQRGSGPPGQGRARSLSDHAQDSRGAHIHLQAPRDRERNRDRDFPVPQMSVPGALYPLPPPHQQQQQGVRGDRHGGPSQYAQQQLHLHPQGSGGGGGAGKRQANDRDVRDHHPLQQGQAPYSKRSKRN